MGMTRHWLNPGFARRFSSFFTQFVRVNPARHCSFGLKLDEGFDHGQRWRGSWLVSARPIFYQTSQYFRNGMKLTYQFVAEFRGL